MRIDCKVDIDVAAILASRGLGPDKRAALFLASEVKRLSDPYVPFRQGTLKHTTTIQPDGNGATLIYRAPYAHYQWFGEAMAGRAPKHYTGRPLTYSGGGLRGPRWTERMMADRREDIIRSLKNYIGGGGA